MARRLRWMWWAIEINLVLWLMTAGILLRPGGDFDEAKGVAISGAVLAAVLQHWAYYGLYKRLRPQEQGEHS